MAHPQEQRTRVRTAYVNGKTLRDAAEACGISYNTARAWRTAAEDAGDNWDRARSARRLTGSGREERVTAILEDFLLAHETAVRQVKEDMSLGALVRTESLAKLSDAFSKTMAALGRASPELDKLGVAIEILEQLSVFTQQHFPQHALVLLEAIDSFGRLLTRGK